MCGEFALRPGEELVSALLGVAAQGPARLRNVATAHLVSLPVILRAPSPFCVALEPGRARLTPVSAGMAVRDAADGKRDGARHLADDPGGPPAKLLPA